MEALANKIRSSSSTNCHVYHHVGGEDTHPCAATKVGKPTQGNIPVTKKNNQQNFFLHQILGFLSSIKCHVELGPVCKRLFNLNLNPNLKINLFQFKPNLKSFLTKISGSIPISILLLTLTFFCNSQ